jgi:hypothetical protein
MKVMDEFNDKFKNAAEHFSLLPSSGVWRNIQADIEYRARNRKLIIFLFLVAGIFTVALLFTYMYIPSKMDYTSQNNAKADISFSKFSNSRTNQGSANIIKPHQTIKTKGVLTLRTNKYENSITQATSLLNNTRIDKDNTQIGALTIQTTSVVTKKDNNNSSSIIISNDTLQSVSIIDKLKDKKKDSIEPLDSNAGAWKDKTTNRWSLSVDVAPSLSFDKLSEIGDYQFISNYRDSTDKNILTWNYRLAIYYKIIPQLEIFSGLGIVNFKQDIKNKQAVYRYDTGWLVSQPMPRITLVRAFANINGDSTGSQRNKFTYLEIPLGISYNFLPGHKFNIALQPQLSFDKLIYYSGYIYNFQNSLYEKITASDIRSWLLSYGVGIAFQYTFQKKFCIEIVPSYKSYNKSIYRSSYPISQRIQQIEFRLSLYYLIK